MSSFLTSEDELRARLDLAEDTIQELVNFYTKIGMFDLTENQYIYMFRNLTIRTNPLLARRLIVGWLNNRNISPYLYNMSFKKLPKGYLVYLFDRLWSWDALTDLNEHVIQDFYVYFSVSKGLAGGYGRTKVEKEFTFPQILAALSCTREELMTRILKNGYGTFYSDERKAPFLITEEELIKFRERLEQNEPGII